MCLLMLSRVGCKLRHEVRMHLWMLWNRANNIGKSVVTESSYDKQHVTLSSTCHCKKVGSFIHSFINVKLRQQKKLPFFTVLLRLSLCQQSNYVKISLALTNHPTSLTNHHILWLVSHLCIKKKFVTYLFMQW